MNLYLVLPAAVIVITAVTVLAPKTGVAAPLILGAVGTALALLPGFPQFVLEPELILAGILPPLLYSAAVAMPVMDFRRDFGAISLLSVLLVLISAVVLGFVFRALIPDIGLPEGIALGAILSPTDAVATSIVKGLGAPGRVITVLEGGGLLNDATSMVLMRSAIAATVAAVTLHGFLANFAWAIIGAVICGVVAGVRGLIVRRKIREPALTTAVSFVVPFLAFIPAEEIGASGLVAVVVAGIITGYGSAKYLTPQDRLFEHANWSTVGTLIEGALFLLMGLQLPLTVMEVLKSEDHLPLALTVSALAIVLVLLVRALFIAPLLLHLHNVATTRGAQLNNIMQFQNAIDARVAEAGLGDEVQVGGAMVGEIQRGVPVSRLKQFRLQVLRRIADTDYLVSKPLGPREGALLVWSGMRGVVTLAAAQTLPLDFPHRPTIVLIAFLVALGTLVMQGGTLPWVVKRLGLAHHESRDPAAEFELRQVMDQSARRVLTNTDLRRPNGTQYDPVVVNRMLEELDEVSDKFDDADDPDAQRRLEEYAELQHQTLAAQREALLEVRSEGTQDSEHLADVLNEIDVQQIALEIREGQKV